MGEQYPGAARVLAGDPIRDLQNLKRPQRDVAEVPDRGRHEDDLAALFVRIHALASNLLFSGSEP